ncbi:MAG: gliding motility-associated C-terminal domain-containing protein [Bacteroidetes bacterium]|nr:gliding motility-associated C-terminal domain-containing protein [Bacteroidota bacterium]
MKNIINLFLALFISLSTFAAPGDDCSTAILVSSNGCSAAGAYNNTGIVGTLAPPSCFGGGTNNGMWFKFIASGPVVNITVNGGTLASPMIGLFSSSGACVSPFTQLGCSNPGGTTASLPYSALVSGNTYYIYVDGANNNVGTFQLCLTSPAQPANDDPCNAITLPTSNFCSGSNAYTTVGATGENLTSVFIPTCFDNPGVWNSVWFKFTAVGTTAVVSINGGIVRPQVAIIQLTGACSGTTYNNFGCSQAAAGNTTTLTVANVVPGTTYYIVVDGYSSNTGAFEICLNNYNPTGTVINDDCSNATPLCPNNHYYSTTNGATPVNDPDISQWSCNGVVDNSVWLKFTTTNPVQAVNFAINATCSADALQFEVFRKTTGAASPCATTTGWTSVGCNNSISPSGSAVLNIPAASLVANTDYYVVVDNWPGDYCDFDFVITGNQGVNAAADQTVCANAAAFTLPGFAPSGGTWSGPGVTAAGVFNPATAGIGTHMLYYTLGPCTDSKIVKVTGPAVNVSNSVSVCPGVCTTILGDATMPQIITTSPSFSTAANITIPTAGTSTATSVINVSGLGNASLSSICLNINHTYDSDLDIYLICPSGATLELSTDNGAGGDNYSGTCFNTTSGTNITSGAAPFNLGAGYIPEGGSLTTLNNCTMNGNWTLKVVDDASGDGGTFVNWTLNFNNNVTNTIPATSYTWSPTTAMTGGTTLSPTVCPVATTVYSLTGTDSNGCTATDEMTVTVTPLAISVTPNQNICAGASTTLTASGATSYTWSPATGLSSVSGAAVVASPTVTTTYTVVGAQGTCTNTKTVTVTVGTVTLAATGTTYCAGGSGSISASGAVTYTWSPATGLSSSNGAAVTANPASTTIYTVNGTTAGGCIGTQTVAVIVNPNPAATLSFTNPTCGLNNGQIFINNTSLGVQTVTLFASSLGSVSGQTVTGLGAGTPVITLTNNSGCTFTVSATLTMTPGPTNITITPTNATCGNSNGSFTFGTPTGGTSPFTYAINGGAFTATSPTVSLPVGTYSVTVKDLNNCTYTKTTTIVNVPGPTAIAGTSSPAGCSLSNGSYTISGVTGGTPTYSFAIDGGALTTTSVSAGLSSGTHTVSVKDASACTYSTTFNVATSSGPTSATIATGLATCGSANGSATVTGVTGGVATYSFSFDGGAFSATNNTGGLTASNHTVVVKDANSCTLTVTYNVSNAGSPTATVTGFTNPLCSGGSTGSFSVSASGGSGAPFTYTLTSPFQTNTTGIFSGLPAGAYNLTIRDVSNCITTASVTLTDPAPVVITATAVPVKCFGTATGTVNVTGSGGTPTYSYNLNGGAYQTSTAFPNQFAATYIMGVKDSHGCTGTQTVTVTQPAALAIVVSTQNANCTAANGVASTTVTGGTGTITYTWTGGGGAAAISNNVVGGSYTVTATDANNCSISSPAVIGITPGGTAAITASTNITCNGANNGSMTTGMTGGTSPFTYSWTTTPSQTAATATNLAPGTYTCKVTDFYGCIAFASGTLTQPPVLNAIMNSNNVKCFGTATGTVSAAGSGGTGPYNYLWTSPITSTLSTINNVGVGNYSCNITDANGCTITRTITVTQPTSVTLTSTVTPASCNQSNGSGTVTASGGAPGAYTYTWSSGSNTVVQNAVPAGTYTINVQDANNCLQTLAVTIPNLSGPTISITSQTNVSCFGGNNGLATALASVGTGTYNYSWSHGAVTSTAANLTAGIYTVSVTDQTGCVASTSVNITQPTPLSLTITPTNPKCFGATNGSANATVLGGTPSYSYAWTSTGGTAATSNPLGAGNYGLTVTDGNGCVITSSVALVNPPAMSASITSTNVTCFGTCNGVAVASNLNGVGAVNYQWTGGASPVASQTLTGACAGSYTVLATDQNNCTASAQITVTEPPVLTANISSTGSITCNGGNNGFAVVTPGGGTGAYSYNWTPSGGNAANANSLTAGVYVITVKDINLCSATATATILEPTALSTTLTSTNVKCNGACDGTANIAFSGGTGTTTFLWLPGLQSGNSVNNLCAGNQTVNITSNGSCVTTRTFVITEPTALVAVGSATSSNCGQANGKTCATVSGGTAPYSSTIWSNNVTTLCNNNILAGAYTFTVTDANGCVALASGLINDIAGPVVTITGSTAVKCFNGMDGAATATISGGVGTYSISWTGTQAGPNSTTNPTNLGAGLHQITVVDGAGCIGTDAVTITQPTQLVSAIGSFTNVSCNGSSDGGATILVNGGTAPYGYTWTPSAQTSSVLINVPANVYTGNVKDANGCLTSSQVTISQPPVLAMIAYSVTNITCYGANNGQISTTIQGGSPGYTFSWTPTVASPGGLITGLAAGSYTLKAVDMNACSINANFTILEPAALTSTYTSLPATCGLANGSATVFVAGGTPSYNVVWSLPGTPTGSVVSNMAPGNNWIANISDAHGCSITQTVVVANPPLPSITGFNVTPPSCFGFSDGDITVNYTSGTAPYTIAWANPISQTVTTSALSQSVAGVAGGFYTATVTDNYGCSVSQGQSVTPPQKLTLNVSSDATICYGTSTQIDASGSGGNIGAYSYTWTPTAFSGGGPHIVSPTTTSAYNVSVSDVKGCTYGPKVITINVKSPLNASGTTSTICHLGQATLKPSIDSPGNGGPYTYTWTPTALNTSSITVTGAAPVSITTNTYAVTISDGCSIPNAIAIFTVNVNPLPVASFTAFPLQGCAPLSVTLTGTSNGASDVFYWSDNKHESLGQGNPSIYPVYTDSGKYSIKLTVINPVTTCSASIVKSQYIEVYPQPIASFYATPSVASILDPNFNFTNTSQGAVSYYWDFGDPAAVNGNNNSTVTNPSHGYTYTGEYAVNLMATSSKGCKDIARILIEVKPDFAIYIPNAFTPDGNGLNDVFQPLGVGIDEDDYRLDIFDRWGENIFTSNNFRKGWDGTVKGGSKMAEQGVYTYKLVVRDIQGGKHPYVGHVTVIKKDN